VNRTATTVGEVGRRHPEPHLRVAIGPDGHLGTSEQPRRFLVVDTHGELRGRCRALEGATAVLTAVDDHSRRRRPVDAG